MYVLTKEPFMWLKLRHNVDSQIANSHLYFQIIDIIFGLT
jgi:hypothetical protein